MSTLKSFQEIKSWQEARLLVRGVFLLKGRLDKDWATRDQLRRASLSIMNNIAEGFGRFSDRDFSRFLKIAYASASEVKSILFVLEDLGYCTDSDIQALHKQVDKVQANILAFIRYLDNNTKSGAR